MTVGYHADASKLAPEGLDHRLRVELGRPLHRHREDGARRQLHRQQVQRQLPGRLQDGRQPVRAVEVRAAWSRRPTKKQIAAAKAKISTTGSPFAGPVYAQDGKVLFAAGVIPTYAADRGDRRVRQGCRQGDIPKS